MPPLDTPPRFQLALRLTALGVQAGFTFSIALVAADIAGQLAPPHQRALDRARGRDGGAMRVADVGLDLEARGTFVAVNAQSSSDSQAASIEARFRIWEGWGKTSDNLNRWQ